MDIKQILFEFEEFLKANLPKAQSFHPHFEAALQEMLLAGGKRFRPLLLLSVVDALEPLLVKNAFFGAMAIELLHTYSLIHDDLPAMDNADLRRGHPTLHKTYDEVTAILVGDALNTHAFLTIANAPLSSEMKVELIKTLGDDGGVGGMVLGQAIDCFFENKRVDFEELKFLHIHKTGRLIAASLKMGAITANAPSEVANGLYDFGLDLGLLFQIEDDLIDATKTEAEAGKSVGNDGAKNSFVNILGLEGAQNAKNELLEKVKADAQNFGGKLSQNLTQIVNNYFK